MRRLLPLLLLGLAGCATPPASVFVGGSAGSEGEPVGNNAVGEACTRSAASDGGFEIFCGTWTQPSARIRQVSGDIGSLAAGGAWRSGLDQRFACNAPRSTTILGDQPALVLECTRRAGGWPHVGLVASVGGQSWVADGVLPSLPAMERAIGIATGRARAEAANAPASGAEQLLADRLAARAFGSNDIGAYEGLMAAGSRANQAENYAAAETAYRAALGLQERALGADNPALATTLALLSLQLSNQGRFPAADDALNRADTLSRRAGADATLPGRVAHYRGLHLLNQDKHGDALAQLDRAATEYSRQLPASVLAARQAPRGADPLGGGDLLANPQTRTALLGLVEVRRYRAVALRGLNRGQEAEDSLRAAATLARANRVQLPVVNARLARAEAMAEAARGDTAAAAAGLGQAASTFARGVPNTRPVARTELLRAEMLSRLNRPNEVLAACRNAVGVLTQLRSGIEAELLEPCLAAWHTVATRGGNNQALLEEMFSAAQLAQSGVTAQQIDQATVRLADAARNPAAGEAIRRFQDAQNGLGDLLRERDTLLAEGRAPAAQALESRIADARQRLSEADDALQAAAPQYGQLVQQAVSAREVLAALRPNEAFASIVLTGQGGWTFVLRDGRIAAAPVEGGEPRMARLVRRVRGSIERTGPGLPTFDTAAAAEIYAATLGQVGSALEGATALSVAPSGPLLALPFEVLLTGPANPNQLAQAPFLVRRVAIAHVPAAANFVGLRRLEPSRAQRAWFGFGDFRPPSRAQAARSFPAQGCTESAALFAALPPLPFATRELDAARQILGARADDRLLGPAFTADAVRRTSLRDFRVLHFATHAVLPAEIACQPEPAILASTPPNAPDATPAMLTASAIANLDLDADLVILSACNSGGPGGSTAGESLSGLARSFFYAGARALLVTHWAVDDRMAAFLVVKTMAERAGGRGSAAALRAAQLSVLDDAGRGLPVEAAHPFFWAPFAVIGEGGPAAPVSLAAASRL
ncbi:CHAT domain-containing protein [Falsiroseomonas oryziterrae]|uniref:CHAT domain-containing protein n=1 Tax=Falsiroseomonas oryziterrae TaxID=2911368 RepID=UPI001F1C2CF6|nr:CHAT domain-containing protein [Roseomonas sp. NPKOSM-4]